MVSFPERSTEAIPGEGIRHMRSRSEIRGRRFLLISAADRREFGELVEEASHVQRHILCRYHAHLTWIECRRTHKAYWVVPHGSVYPRPLNHRE